MRRLTDHGARRGGVVAPQKGGTLPIGMRECHAASRVMIVGLAAPVPSDRLVKSCVEIVGAGKPLRGEELGGRE